jgi:hypothetical protein
MTLSAFTKIREPIPNSIIAQLCISDTDDIYLLTEGGAVYKSSNMKSIIDMRFEEITFPNNKERIVKIAPGFAFISILTENGKCFSLLDEDRSILIESGKLKELNVIDINAGAQHVLVSTMLRNGEDENGNQESMLNQTYTINFKKITEMGSGVENYQHPYMKLKKAPFESMSNGKSIDDDKNENLSLIDMEESIRGNNGSRATTMECKDTESSNHSSAHKNSSDERPDSAIRFIDNGIDQVLSSAEGNVLLIFIYFLFN